MPQPGDDNTDAPLLLGECFIATLTVITIRHIPLETQNHRGRVIDNVLPISKGTHELSRHPERPAFFRRKPYVDHAKRNSGAKPSFVG